MLRLRTDELTPTFKPLDRVTIDCEGGAAVTVRDGLGRVYVERPVRGASFAFRVAGALGRHVVELTDESDRGVETLSFAVNCTTGIDDRGGAFRRLLDMLHWTMAHHRETDGGRFQDREYRFFVRWLRDHVHTMKGMKYFYPNLKDGIDLYADTQREDGMIWDNITPRSPEPNVWDWRFEYGGFIRKIQNGTAELKRIPVENDVEYLFLEGLYYTWKAVGDDDWMADRLDTAIRAFEYSTTSPYRWSERYKLLKRGYTIDTWDFQSAEDTQISGDTMAVHLDRTRFGVMHGDNTGFAVGCEYLAEMLEHVGRDTEARRYRRLGEQIRRRLDKLAWNGRFYTHHVPEDRRVRRDLGVDESRQVSLSNAYALNRRIDHKQCVAILKTYQRIRREMPDSSPGEFYQIYPPFEKGFGGHNSKWEYMNGGVTTIVAGELAHGAFEHGFEDYGADILRRVTRWGEEHDGYFHCTLRGAAPEKPKRRFTSVSLRKVANTDFRGEGGPGVPGWTGEGENDLADMPTGRRRFQDIPFSVIDPAKNDRRACLGLSTRPGGYATEASLPVGRKAASVYLLHTLAGGGLGGTVVFRYADGSAHTEYIYNGRHVGGWWTPSDPPRNRRDMPTAKVAWRGRNRYFHNVGVYVCGLENPRPGEVIETIELQAARNDNFWAVLGVTLCDKPVFFMPSDVSFGIPNNWGAAAVVYALIEGLAGVKDTGVAFDRALLAPRWSAAGVDRVEATVKYEASGGYVRYKVKHDKKKRTITLDFTGSAGHWELQVLLPEGKTVRSATLDGEDVEFKTRNVQKSVYACADVQGIGPHRAVLCLR